MKIKLVDIDFEMVSTRDEDVKRTTESCFVMLATRSLIGKREYIFDS